MSAKDVVHGNPTHTQRWVWANANFLFFFFSGNDATSPMCESGYYFFFYVLCSFLVCVAAPGLKENNEKI